MARLLFITKFRNFKGFKFWFFFNSEFEIEIENSEYFEIEQL